MLGSNFTRGARAAPTAQGLGSVDSDLVLQKPRAPNQQQEATHGLGVPTTEEEIVGALTILTATQVLFYRRHKKGAGS